MLKKTIDTLHETGCSLVVEKDGAVHLYYQKGVRDMEELLDNQPQLLRDASIADKVIGKAAAGMAIVGGVSELYADVLSQKAVPLLDEAGVSYSYGMLVEQIVYPDGQQRCPLEQIVAGAQRAEEVVRLLRSHFAEMKKMNNKQLKTIKA